MTVEENIFRAAMEAIEQNDRARARNLLTRLIKKRPKIPEYWLWMSSVVETSRERVFCLKEAQKLDPENPLVRRGLILSGELPRDEKLVVPVKQQMRRWQVHLEKRPSLEDAGIPFSWKKAALTGGAVVVLVGFVIFALLNSRQPQQAASVQPRRTATITQTPIPVLTLAAKEVPSGSPTPLWMFLPATYTPTPLYVNTPHPRSEAYRTALRSMQKGDYQAMLAFLDQALALQPDAADLYYYKGEAYRLLENTNQALKSYQRALELDKAFAPAYLGMGRIAASSNRIAEAQNYFQKAISLDAGYAEVYLEQAALDLQKQEPEAALSALKTAAVSLPDSTLLHFYMAQAHLLAGDYQAALEEAHTAQKLDVTFLPVYRLIGQISLATGKLETTVEYLQTYLRYEPRDEQASAWLGAAYAASGQDDLALQVFDQAIQAGGRTAEAYLQRGLLYQKNEQVDLAIQDLDAAIRIEKSYAAFIALGKTYWMAGDERRAYVQFANAEGYAKSDLQKAEMYFWRAQSLLKIGEEKAAIRDWKALLALPRENIPTEWIGQAEDTLQQLITLTPSPKPPTATNTLRPTLTVTASRTPIPSVTATPKSNP